ncbi:hypothetical protein [Bartonella sp. B41]
MSTKFFFISSAITSGLAFALQSPDRIVSQHPMPFVAPFTIPETGLQIIEQTNDTLDTLNGLKPNGNNEIRYNKIEE